MGSDANAGRFLEADLEGLSDSSFHFYAIGKKARHLGSFLVDGVGDTDGVHYVPLPIGKQYPLGLLVVQIGLAPEPPDTGDINGFIGN